MHNVFWIHFFTTLSKKELGEEKRPRNVSWGGNGRLGAAMGFRGGDVKISV